MSKLRIKIPKIDERLDQIDTLLNSTAVSAQALEVIKLAVFGAVLATMEETIKTVADRDTPVSDKIAGHRKRIVDGPLQGETPSGMKITSYGDNR